MMILAHIASGDGSLWPSGKDALPFLFFPFGLAVSLVIAMKWEGIGGLMVILCMIAWHITMNMAHGNPDISAFIDGLAVPGVLFLVVWIISRKHMKLRKEKLS